ncbi:MAG: uracil-DNA glycosylase family protein [Tepidimonas sp.]
MNLPHALPWLDERRSALLAEIGVPAWWQPRALLPRPAAPAEAPTLVEPTLPVRTAPIPKIPAPEAPAPVPIERPVALQPATEIATLDWPELETAIHACQRCGLAACRQRPVPGVGDRRPTWLIVGEAPGEEEDRQGEPFVGRTGRLLDRMLAALDLQRGHGVYIANVLKCRPPRNRNPEPEEIARCAPYLLRQIALLQPRLVLALGRFAAQTLLAEGGCLPAQELAATPLGRLRGRVFQARLGQLTLPVVVSYHPAYLLRNPVDKGKAWADLCLAAETLASADGAALGAPPA